MKKIGLIGLVLSCGLSSCGIYGSYKPVEELPLASYGDEAALLPASEDSVASLGSWEWKELLTDPLLQTLVEKGLAQNNDLLIAEQRINASKASLRAAKLAFFPSLSLAPQGTVTTSDLGSALQTYTLPVSASWEVDLFGRVRNAKQQAKAAYWQSVEYKQAVKTQLVAGIANSYFSLLMVDEQLRITEQTAESWKEAVASMQAMMRAGMANETAVAQYEATYYQICTSVLTLKEQRNQTENALSLLLGEPLQNIERGTLAEQTLPTHFSIGVPVEMLSNRPDVRLAERQLEQAFYVTNQARSAFYPSLVLNGSAGWSNSAGTMIMNPALFMATAVASLTQPIFAKGQNSAQLRRAKAQQEEAKLSFQQTVLSAGNEVNNALVQFQTAQEKRAYLDKQIASLKRAYEHTSLLMKHSSTTYLDVLTARQGLLNAELTQVANRFSELQGVINLYSALGGGK